MCLVEIADRMAYRRAIVRTTQNPILPCSQPENQYRASVLTHAAKLTRLHV